MHVWYRIHPRRGVAQATAQMSPAGSRSLKPKTMAPLPAALLQQIAAAVSRAMSAAALLAAAIAAAMVAKATAAVKAALAVAAL